jgi:predicted amidophosphoribosyltransferase
MAFLLRELTALLAPPLCAACATAAMPGRVLCSECLAALRSEPPWSDSGPPGVELAVSACEFDDVARAVVHGLKYGRRLGLADVAAEAIEAACPPGELRGTVVPVPASPLRWRWRGFDPAEEIALALTRLAGLPYSPCLRRAHGPRQVGRSRRARLAEPPRVRVQGMAPRRALLVDDVRTTGATLASCASALRAAGAKAVVALTFAHA